jgi:hypothetical protein
LSSFLLFCSWSGELPFSVLRYSRPGYGHPLLSTSLLRLSASFFFSPSLFPMSAAEVSPAPCRRCRPPQTSQLQRSFSRNHPERFPPHHPLLHSHRRFHSDSRRRGSCDDANLWYGRHEILRDQLGFSRRTMSCIRCVSFLLFILLVKLTLSPLQRFPSSRPSPSAITSFSDYPILPSDAQTGVTTSNPSTPLPPFSPNSSSRRPLRRDQDLRRTRSEEALRWDGRRALGRR